MNPREPHLTGQRAGTAMLTLYGETVASRLMRAKEKLREFLVEAET